MSDLEHQTEEEFDTSEEAELAALKERAKMMGLKLSPKIGLEKLKAKIEAKLNPPVEETADPGEETEIQRKARIRKKQISEQMVLIRCRIANLNPSKRDLRGEIFTVANKYVGTVRKFIPYGEATDNGYHIPQILYEQLKTRKFLQVNTRNDRSAGNQIVVDQRWVPEFSIEVLPKLTQEELDKLAASQAAAGGVS
jgi:hypothetical protein